MLFRLTDMFGNYFVYNMRYTKRVVVNAAPTVMQYSGNPETIKSEYGKYPDDLPPAGYLVQVDIENQTLMHYVTSAQRESVIEILADLDIEGVVDA